MSLMMFLEALGGLGLFILGMKIMSEGLQRLAGERLRRSLERLAGNRVTASFLGSSLTALLQSGGAASIIIIGFVNAGLLSLYQALGMLIGTSLGTTFVVQLIAFRIYFVAAPGIFFGAVLKFFSKRRRRVHFGEVLLGLSLIFFGLSVMEANFAPLKESAIFSAFHQGDFPMRRVSEVILGALLTFFVQSGSAAIAIIIALSSGGFLPFEPAVAMVLGEAMGTTWLAAIGTINGTMAAKRAVLIYFLMIVFLLTAVMLCFPYFLKLVLYFSPHGAVLTSFSDATAASLHAAQIKATISRSLANAHTIFSIIGVLLFLPLVGLCVRSASKILPGREKDLDMEHRLAFIDFRVLDTPVIAFSLVGNEVKRMAELSRSMFRDVVRLFDGYDARKASVVIQKENVLDALQKDISSFLVILAKQQLTPEISVGLPAMLQAVNGLENIGDNSEIILECLSRKKEGNVYFSDAAMDEIRHMASMTNYMIDRVVDVFDTKVKTDIQSEYSLCENIRSAGEELKKRHVSRLSSGSCTVIAGLLYIDILSAFEKISELSMEIIKDQRSEP
jgi:phosphate:Na+ symporter